MVQRAAPAAPAVAAVAAAQETTITTAPGAAALEEATGATAVMVLTPGMVALAAPDKTARPVNLENLEIRYMPAGAVVTERLLTGPEEPEAAALVAPAMVQPTPAVEAGVQAKAEVLAL